jgi:hypothetical protein
MPRQVVSLQVTQNFCPTWIQIIGSRDPFPQVWQFSRLACRTQGTFTYAHLFTIKDKNGNQMRDGHRANMEAKCELRTFMPFPGLSPSWHFKAFTNPEALRNPLLRIFMDISLWLNHWLLAMWPNLQLSSPKGDRKLSRGPLRLLTLASTQAQLKGDHKYA